MNHHDSVMLNGDSKETAREPLLPRRGHRSFNDSALLSTVRRDKVETAKRRELTRAFSMSPSSGPPPKLEMHARSRWGVLRPGSANPPVGLGKEPSLTEYTPCLGIDLGTTNSCVAAWNGKTATVLRSFQYSSTLIPSVVAYTKKDVLVGHAAVKQWAQNPKDTIFSSKRWMARPYDSAAIEASKKYPFDVVDDGLGQSAFKVSCREKPISPEQLGGYILEHIKSFAVTDHLRCDVRDAVITVPAYFNDAQRAATKKAGELAGLRVLMVLNEPTAAALACGLHEVKTEENLWQKKNILVFDLGGGTFDVTVMFMDKKRFEVLSTGGDTHLGGDDFDQAILEYFKTDMAKKWSDLPVDDDGMLQLTPFEHVKLLHRSREVKEALAGVPTQTFEIEIQNRIYTGQLSRARMDSLCGKLVSKVIGIMDSVLRNSGLHKGSIDDVVLVGGSTKMKKIQDMIESFFKGFKAFLVKTHSPDEIVAEGAVVKAAVMLETECKIPPPSLPLISDVVPQTVGVALPEDTYNVVIPRNSPIPSSQKLEKFFVYHTTKDFQTSMAIHVYQGEDTKATGNFFLGTCILEGIPPRLEGEVDVCVKYAFDHLGILEITGWVQGMGHITTRIEVTDEAYEKHDGYSKTHEAGGVTGLQCDNQLSNVQFSFSFFSASSDVPRDSEDRRIDEERQREYARLKEQKRKERKEAKDREKKEKEKEEQRLSQLKALSQRQLTVNSARPASTRSVMSVVNSARKPSS